MSFPSDPTSPLPANTTVQQDITTAGQRKVNLIWESTQATIAIAAMGGYIAMVIHKIDIPNTLDHLLFVIVTFYFARTNHTRVGGVGVSDFQQWRGR